jgi:DNA-binding transcriptional LysR family regulator
LQIDFPKLGNKPVHWDDLRFFLAVAYTKSLSGAAWRLGVSPSTVSRRIDVLEGDLNVRLFRPHRDGYDLTQAGRDLIPAAERAAAQMRTFERNAQESESESAGPVCVEAPELLGQDVLLPALTGLLETHPAIRIELRSSVRSVRLASQEADIVLRLVRPDQGSYRQRRLGQIPFGLYASPTHVQKYGTPQRPADLHKFKVIGWTEDLHYLMMATWLETLFPGLQPVMRLSSLNAQLKAVQLGLGWAVLPAFAAIPIGLMQALTESVQLRSDLWLLVHEQSAALSRVELVKTAVVDAVSRCLGDDPLSADSG